MNSAFLLHRWRSKLLLGLCGWGSLLQLGAAREPVDYVNPFIGAVTKSKVTGASSQGKTFPGAATPFGLVQLSPDTITGGDNGSGYNYEHTTIQGFSFTHMSGVGWFGDLGNLLVMPTTGPLKTYYGVTNEPGSGYLSRYDKASETASPGYYSVFLTDYQIRAELASAPHSGILRFTYPQSAVARIQIDLARRVGGTAVRQSVKVVGENAIEGWMECTPDGGGWGNGGGKALYTVFFRAEFSRPIKNCGVWSADIPDTWKRRRTEVEGSSYVAVMANARQLAGVREMEGKHLGFYTEFSTQANDVVLMKAGISFVSVAGARENLHGEIADWDFDGVRERARRRWVEALGRITVTGSDEAKKAAFYTALYHTMIDPRAFADLDGTFPGGDGRPRRSAKYTRRTVFSGWDVFRSELPLLTIIAPNVVNDLINSLVDLADESGKRYLERWEFLNAYSGCMIANPLVPVIADAHAKGIRNFDLPRAYEFARNSCEMEGNGALGFVPGSISRTLECAHDEWCLSRLAAAVGAQDDVGRYQKRAQSYRSLFDAETGWFRVKNANGEWAPISDKGRLEGKGCTEANAYQQGWFVPHDVDGLIGLFGGQEKFVAELDQFFAKTPDVRHWNQYYNHANEPVHLVPFLFNRAGAPALTQKWVRFICDEAYGSDVYGLCGDEDVGQMSAWFVLAASGFHPANPGDSRYELFSPVFDKVVINTDPKYASGRPFTIVARNNSKENIYVQSAMLNGRPLNRCWISHAEIAAGGKLEFTLGPNPSRCGTELGMPAAPKQGTLSSTQ